MRCVLSEFSSCNERKFALKETENNMAAKKMHAYDWIRHVVRSPHAVFHLDFKLVQNLVGRDGSGREKIHAYN